MECSICSVSIGQPYAPEFGREHPNFLGSTLGDRTSGGGAGADVPRLPEPPRAIRLKYLTEVNRWTTLTGSVLLHDATGGEPSRSLLWRDLLAGYGIVDIASVA